MQRNRPSIKPGDGATETVTLNYGHGRRLDEKDVAPPQPKKDTAEAATEKAIAVGGDSIKSIVAQVVAGNTIKFSGAIPSVKDQESMPKTPNTAGDVLGKRPDVEVKGIALLSIVAAKVEADTLDFSS